MDIKSVVSNEVGKPIVAENKTFDPDKRIDVTESKVDFASVDKGFDPDKRVENAEKQGGSYAEVKKHSNGETHEVHHMPADSASYLERNDGPAIKMEKADHRQTASCGSTKEAREYQATQKNLIEQGQFREALQMDMDDIRDKFGNKYDSAISEMLSYVDKLESEGKI